jgi:hypothetical protein
VVRSIDETAAAKQAKKATRDGARRMVDQRDDPTQRTTRQAAPLGGLSFMLRCTAGIRNGSDSAAPITSTARVCAAGAPQ